MGDVSNGPVASLPGSRHSVSQGMKCDDCENTATRRIQGETDSFGCEYHDLCDTCAATVLPAGSEGGFCDFCKTDAERLFPVRDPDEGMAGPVYFICRPCKDHKDERERAEAEEYWRDNYDPRYDDDD